MENGPPTPGLDDGTIDVEHLFVEPQDGHGSMDSVIRFNEKIPGNAMDMEDVSHSFGRTDTDIAQEGKDILNGEVLDVMPSEVEAGYFRLHGDFCSMGEDYLLGSGVEFTESITNFEYGSSEGLRASDIQMHVSTAVSDVAWKSDQFRIMQVPDCSNDQFNLGSSKLSDITSCHECQMAIEEKPAVSHRSCNLQNISKLQSRGLLSDNERLTPSGQMFCSLKTQKHNAFELKGQEVKTNTFHGHQAAATMSVEASCSDVLRTQKRARKPTQRYIDELADPISTHSKKRRSSSTLKEKSLGVKDHKKCHTGSRELGLPSEESSVKAIQVPFGSLVHNECPKEHAYDTVDSRNLRTMAKGKRVTPENQKKRDEFVTVVHLKIRDDCAAAHKDRDACVTAVHKKKRDGHITAANQKKRNDCTVGMSPKKRDNRVAAASQKKRDDYLSETQQNRRDCAAAESLDEASGRRKHHRLWTISEVKKLIDGVSQYGVGRWSRIKKLFFSASTHRTSVDLKDKWRNLLKASGIQERGNQQGEKKRNVAWRPLPKSILRRVCELATMHPYPKGQRPKMGHVHHDSPDRSADITLSDYRRILRSINGN